MAAAARRMQIGAQVMAALSDETLGKAERQREEDTLGWKQPIDVEFDKNEFRATKPGPEIVARPRHTKKVFYDRLYRSATTSFLPPRVGRQVACPSLCNFRIH